VKAYNSILYVYPPRFSYSLRVVFGEEAPLLLSPSFLSWINLCYLWAEAVRP
jgi:hypothetical protein